MQSTRVPRALRILKVCPKNAGCNSRNMSFFPRFVSHDYPRISSSDFAPVWRLIDDYANQVVSARNSEGTHRSIQTFNPRFDVQEVQGAYELKGELPGVEQKNIEIEFPDQQTIVIKGQTGYDRQASSQAEDAAPHSEATPSETSHQATVEDEPEVIDASEANDPAESTPEGTPAAALQTQSVTQATVPAGKYWVTERFTGSFQRTFSFPAPVDTDNVKARLRNGVLEISIPKVQKAGIKRIAVE